MNPKQDALEQLIHDINSKCASLKSAATLFKIVSPEEIREIIELMAQEVETLSRKIVEYQKRINKDRIKQL